MVLDSTVSSEFVLVSDCVDNMGEFEVDPSEHTLMLFGKVDRCLRVLEQVIGCLFSPKTKQEFFFIYVSRNIRVFSSNFDFL